MEIKIKQLINELLFCISTYVTLHFMYHITFPNWVHYMTHDPEAHILMSIYENQNQVPNHQIEKTFEK